MPDIFSTAVVLVLLCAAAGGGNFVKTRLPERHRSRDSFELVQTSINLLVTFTAIVLGLLTTSVKSGFDAAYTARGQYAAALAQMDKCLQDYGPETDRMREDLRAYVAAVIASTWPDEKPPEEDPLSRHEGHAAHRREPRARGDHRRGRQQNTSPRTHQLAAQTASNRLRRRISDLVKSRWTVIEQARASISPPFYWVLVLWLVILFASIGLTAGKPGGCHRHRAVRDFDHVRRFRHPGSRHALRRPVRHPEHVDAGRPGGHVGALIVKTAAIRLHSG